MLEVFWVVLLIVLFLLHKEIQVLLQTKDVIFNSYLRTSHAPTQTGVMCRGRGGEWGGVDIA